MIGGGRSLGSSWLRWALLPLAVWALLAPAQPCAEQPLVSFKPPAGYQLQAGETTADGQRALAVPPLRPGHPAAFWGTDRLGRDNACLNQRGLKRSLSLAVQLLSLALLPGILLGVWLGWRGWSLSLPHEVLLLLIGVLLLGALWFRLVLLLGVVLWLARAVAVRVQALLKEPFVEGAIALGGSTLHLWRWHLWPEVRRWIPLLCASALSALSLWLMELGALGFYDQGSLIRAFSDSFDLVPDVVQAPISPDLGQLIATARWAWLDHPEQLVFPALLLTALALSGKAWARGR